MSETSLFPDYVIDPQKPPPADYPFEQKEDQFSALPFASTYIQRSEALLEFVLGNPSPTNIKAPFFELARMAAGGTPHNGIFEAACDYIDARLDCADFPLHAILRLLYQFRDNPHIDPSLLQNVEQSIFNFKYWPDEPGIDSMCTWTENHYILFASAAYLAGQQYPEQVFTNSGLTGKQLMERHRPRILRWMNMRFFTGFSEWLSNIYYNEDLTALLSLVDICQDEEVRIRATMIIDLILLDMALNNYRGVFGCSHGRCYEEEKKWATQECTSSTHKLLFGRGSFSPDDMMSAISFVLSSNYKVPWVLYSIANDQDREELLNRQRMGVLVNHADWWGLRTRDIEDGMTLLTLGAYLHPKTATLFIKMLEAFNWWDNSHFILYKSRRRLLKLLRLTGLLPLVSRIYAKDLSRQTREQVNIYTYRTPDYMLSSALDYKPGFGGDQQHIWQATLGPGAVCFTTHPARLQGPTPNNWSGDGTLPRVAQIKNVLIAIYNISRAPAFNVPNELFYTHAWLPRDHFEVVIQRDGWLFAKHSDGYLALTSQQPYEWRSLPGEDQNREIIVHARQNIWICELGRAALEGDFQSFMDRIRSAPLEYHKLQVAYNSPSQGLLEFGWDGPFRVNGRQVALADHPRYGNSYCQSDFPSEIIDIIFDEQSLQLNWLSAKRQVSSYIP